MNLSDLYERQTISALDWTFGRTVQRLGRCDDPWVGLAAALVSRSASRGDVCLDMALAHAKGEGGILSEVQICQLVSDTIQTGQRSIVLEI